MSALVAYDSSSEEDSPNVNPPHVGSVSQKPSLQEAIGIQSVASSTREDNPLLGPSIPTEISESYGIYDDTDTTELPASERDSIRYLTQPTHPMAEMPPSPSGSPNPASRAKFRHFLDLKTKGVHFNEDLARKNAFRNPSLLQIMVDRAGLGNETLYHSSLPTNVFDASSLPAAGYKEALLKNQQSIRTRIEAEKKALSAAGKRTIEFNSSGVSTTSSATSSPGDLHKRHKR